MKNNDINVLVLFDIESQKYNPNHSLLKEALDVDVFFDYGPMEKNTRVLLLILSNDKSHIAYEDIFVDFNTNSLNRLSYINRQGNFVCSLGNIYCPSSCFEVLAVSSKQLAEISNTWFIPETIQRQVIENINKTKQIHSIDSINADTFEITEIVFLQQKISASVNLDKRRLVYKNKEDSQFHSNKIKKDLIFDSFLIN